MQELSNNYVYITCIIQMENICLDKTEQLCKALNSWVIISITYY